MKKTLVVLMMIALCVPLFAQGKQETPAPTQQETPAPAPAVAAPAQATTTGGSVNAYTTLEEPLAAKLFQEFEAETGIHVNFVRLAGGECVARLEAEKENPQASIWVGGVGLDHITAKSKGLTTPYVSRYASKTPDTFKDPEHYYIGLYVGRLRSSPTWIAPRNSALTSPSPGPTCSSPSTKATSGWPTPIPAAPPTTC